MVSRKSLINQKERKKHRGKYLHFCGKNQLTLIAPRKSPNLHKKISMENFSKKYSNANTIKFNRRVWNFVAGDFAERGFCRRSLFIIFYKSPEYFI